MSGSPRGEITTQPLSSKRSGLQIGVPGANRFRQTHLAERTGENGSGGPRMPRRMKRREEEPPTKTQTQETGATAKESKIEDPAAVREQALKMGVEERSENEREKGQGARGGSSNCSTCGTLLPEAQANACPVCAQSGPDVMALTSVHYRAAGAKFLATVDLFNATEDARDLIMTGNAPNVVSLRYEQDIPGHKDFLKFKVKT
jgi:hypothetical protein